MKNTLLAVMFAAFSLTVTAQSEFNKHQVNFNFGTSTPTGDFADDDINNENSGFAEFGGAFNVGYAYRFHKLFAGTVNISGKAFTLDHELIRSELFNPTAIQGSDADNYLLSSFTIGAKLIVGEKHHFVFNPYIGSALLTFPNNNYAATDLFNTISFEFKEAQLTSLITGFNTGAEFKLSELLSLSALINYEVANFEDEQTVIYTENGISQSTTGDLKLPYSSFGVLVGLNFNF
jgi:hypothetical protein